MVHIMLYKQLSSAYSNQIRSSKTFTCMVDLKMGILSLYMYVWCFLWGACHFNKSDMQSKVERSCFNLGRGWGRQLNCSIFSMES